MLNSKKYKTENLAVCPYLQMQGLKYLRAEIALGKNDKPVVVFVFKDPLNIGMDLELDFVKSDFKRYRDIFLYFRNEIEKLKRTMDFINLQSSRKKDDKYIDENN